MGQREIIEPFRVAVQYYKTTRTVYTPALQLKFILRFATSEFQGYY